MIVLIFTGGLKKWGFLGEFGDKVRRARQLTGCLFGGFCHEMRRVTKTLMAGQESMLHVLKLLGTKTIRIRYFLSNCLCLNYLGASQPPPPHKGARGYGLKAVFFIWLND